MATPDSKTCTRCLRDLPLAEFRRRIRAALKGVGLRKAHRTEVLIGCPLDEFRAHIEQQFKPGMTWKNYRLWHIDHIIPVTAFDLTDIKQQRAAFSWKNSQPLWALDNHRKGNQIPTDLLLIVQTLETCER